MTLAQYVPEYDNSIIEPLLNPEAGADGTVPADPTINPNICLTPKSAAELAEVLVGLRPELFYAPPIKQAPASPFRFKGGHDGFGAVPWFRFPKLSGMTSKGAPVSWPDGTERDAAVLADYFGMPGLVGNPTAILDEILLDIGTVVEGQ